MEVKEIEQLIRFHQNGLNQYRQHISPAAQYLEEQTIKALEELKKRVEQPEITREEVRKALYGS